MPPTRVTAFSAAHRMSHGIHRGPTHVRPLPLPTISTGLADHNTTVFAVSNFTNRGPTRTGQPSNFTRRQRDLRPLAFPCIQNRRRSGTAAKLPAATGPHFDIMNRRSGRNPTQRHAITDVRLTLGAAHHRVAGRNAFGSQNVSLFTVGIVQQRNSRRTVGIVFDVSDLRRNRILISLEIDLPVQPLVTAATVP